MTLFSRQNHLPPPALLLIGCIVILSGCNPFAQREAEAPTFPIPIANRPAELELALTISERQQGLQKRLDLGENEGMAFLFEVPQTASFWMRNTTIPLDIGFFTGDGSAGVTAATGSGKVPTIRRKRCS